ncbi:UPF0496 protein At3g19330 isoform X1 [Cynara cardunculus var. scolymus]|uniref:UPF0496 protein At3g19330 isoform X1 n=1 Tax=Cynara cardunculus var. scolymus TaxID=59895 RepID=UPI000D629659|nr:UPF0496 protein At3g19330 isoform X1 [Cynara cardunculus var. scolymus]XP_024960914.1 UPF0496 protein At3g19330 isoform X1 [Cynara cardunculus var. scolymus]
MLHCLRSSQAATAENVHALPFNGNSADITSRSGSQASPSVSLTNEYALALQTSSYSEIRTLLDIETERSDEITQDQLLAQVLRPNREFVEEVLQRAKPSFVTNLLWSFFDHSENKARMCLDLTQAIRRVRTLISPLQDLLLVLPLNSETDALSSPQRNRAFDLLLKYEQLENPFPDPGSRNVRGMRHCFSDLKDQLESRINKSYSRIRWLRRVTIGSAICLIGTTVGAVIAGVVIASHALIALAATMFFPAFIPSKMEKKERTLQAQLEAAQKGSYVLHEDIITIERLVNHLYSEIEGNKRFIHSGLWRGNDKHSILEVSRQLRRNNLYFQKQLTDLEEHLCLSFAAINRASNSSIEIDQPTEAFLQLLTVEVLPDSAAASEIQDMYIGLICWLILSVC